MALIKISENITDNHPAEIKTAVIVFYQLLLPSYFCT